MHRDASSQLYDRTHVHVSRKRRRVACDTILGALQLARLDSTRRGATPEPERCAQTAHPRTRLENMRRFGQPAVTLVRLVTAVVTVEGVGACPYSGGVSR
jgi:hypothetical protein